MANQRFFSRFFPLLIVLAATGIEPAVAKPRDLSTYPLRVHIFQSDWRPNGSFGGQGSGIANLTDGQEIHGFDFSYYCAINYMKSVGNQAYAAKWKKPGKTIEVVGSAVGNQNKTDTCEFQISLHDYVYDVQNGTLSMFTQDQYKVRIGAALPKTAPVDTDINNYPLRISVLAIDWSPPLNGTRTGSGRGNLVSQAGLSSLDFTTNCVFPFPATAEGHYYAGHWTREGSALVILLRAAGESTGSLLCPLQTSLHTDIYVREGSGAIKAVSPEEYRSSVLKVSTPAAPRVDARKPDGEPAANGGSEPAVQKVAAPHDGDAQANHMATMASGLPDSGKPETVVVTAPSNGNYASTSPRSAQAAALYRKACDAGDADSCSNLGLLYANGTGVPRDYSQAAALYGKSCDAGDGIGCSNLGILYTQGTGVPKDYDRAVLLYRRACDAGSVISCGNLGNMYANGTGVPRDYSQAVTLYRKACDAGSLISCVNLGSMYENGIGVSRDHAQAVSLFRKACDGGVAVACNNLGVMYEKGASPTGPPQ